MKFKEIIARELPFLFSLPALLWQFLFFFVPLMTVIYFSVHLADGPWWRLTGIYFFDLLDLAHARIILRSLLLAVGNALLCLTCAYPIAYFLALYVKRGKGALLFLLTLPFWTNFLVQVYAWFFLLERNGLINNFLLKLGIISQPLNMVNSLFAVSVVMLYCYLPFMIMPLYSILEKLDHSLLEASSDLGASARQTFLRVTVPLSMPGIKTGLLLVFVPSFGEFAIPALLGGGKDFMVGSLISYYFLVARDSALGAAFTVLCGFALLTVAFIFHWYCDRWYSPTKARS